MSKTLKRFGLLVAILLALLADGCSNRDPMIDEMVRRQATHHETLVRQSEDLTKASQRLVESDAQARREQAQNQARLQADLQSQQQNLDQQRDALESERRDIADRRHRDPLLASAIVEAVTLIIAALPIVLLLLLARAARHESSDQSVSRFLVHDLVAEEPLLSSRGLPVSETKALPAPHEHNKDQGSELSPPVGGD